VRLAADSVRDAMRAIQKSRPMLNAAVNDANKSEKAEAPCKHEAP
jgi:hypothetical protein